MRIREGVQKNKIIGKIKIHGNKLVLSYAKLSLSTAKLHTSLSSDQLKLATI